MSLQPEEIIYKREVKSYVLRSRMTLRQEQGLENFWSQYGVDHSDARIDLEAIFPIKGPVILEIGFGMGGSLLKLAEHNPHVNFLGIEVHKPGVGALLSHVNERGLTNVRVMLADATQVLLNNIHSDSLAGVQLFFPDPWPKRRHHKRRLVQAEFVALVYDKLSSGGFFHLATDVADYAEHMFKTVNDHPGFEQVTANDLAATLARPKTKFERRGERLGHCITDLIYKKL